MVIMLPGHLAWGIPLTLPGGLPALAMKKIKNGGVLKSKMTKT